MLTKTKLRALSPGQWARIRVPDFEIWQKPGEWTSALADKEVDVCVVPCYGQRYDSPTYFHWNYRCGYRHPGGSAWCSYYNPTGSMVTPWDFGLIDASTNSPNWDETTSREHHQGKGKWLYEPASDDPAAALAATGRDTCATAVRSTATPFGNDLGDLICPTCEATGLVITQIEVLDHLEAVREAAQQMGLSHQLEKQLDYLAGYGGNKAPSASWARTSPPTRSISRSTNLVPKRSASSGSTESLIFQGPGFPADGSLPSLTVSLASGTGLVLPHLRRLLNAPDLESDHRQAASLSVLRQAAQAEHRHRRGLWPSG